MTNVTISIRTSTDTTPTPPAGYGVFRVRDYPIHGYGYDMDAAQKGVDLWAIVPLWVIETKSFSAVADNVSIFTDVAKLKALQPTDGHTLTEKMGWLVNPDKGNTPMWTGGGDWNTASKYYVGCQLWAGQLCACSLDTYQVNIKGTMATCRKVLPFQKSDWQRQADWLYPYVTIAHKDGNRMTDYVYDRGQIRVMQQVMDPKDYPFANGIVPSAFYVPVDWVSAI